MFKNLMKTWNHEISSRALKNLDHRKPSAFPLAQDLRKFITVLNALEAESLHILNEQESNREAYDMLAKTLLIRMILFNRRRSGEVQRIELAAYTERKDHKNHEDLLNCLSKLERKLLVALTLMKTEGKGDRMVPILLTTKMKTWTY